MTETERDEAIQELADAFLANKDDGGLERLNKAKDVLFSIITNAAKDPNDTLLHHMSIQHD